ncbi:zinc finger and BTB domain-containing protein 41-like [Stigmatopora nigra]
MDVLEKAVVSKRNPGIKSEPSATPVMKFPSAEDLHCPQCFITFSSKKLLQTHVKRTHPEQYTSQLIQSHTLFSCYKCDGNYASPEELAAHREIAHQGDNVPLCPTCNEVFPNYTWLYKHKRHGCTGEWECADCDVHCHALLEFHLHCIQEHDGEVAEETESDGHSCSVCWHRFRTDEALLRHLERVERCRVRHVSKPRGAKRRRKIEEDDDEDDDCEDSQVQQGEEVEKEQLKIPCPHEDCHLTFPSINALRAHKKSWHPPKK